jgi:hypothetical protein
MRTNDVPIGPGSDRADDGPSRARLGGTPGDRVQVRLTPTRWMGGEPDVP